MSSALALVVLALVLATGAAAAPLQWTRMLPAAGSPVPSNRGAMAIGLDAVRQRVIVFGGQGPYGDTWAYNLTSGVWTELIAQQSAVPHPQPRFSMAFGVDTQHQRLVIAAGEGNDHVFYNDAWSFDFTTDSWTQLQPTGDAPATRYGSAGGIAPAANGTLWVSHGFYGLTRLSDTYGVDSATTATAATSVPWRDGTPRSGSAVPFARCLVASSVIGGVGTERVVMFGGCGSLGHGPCPAQDVWVYDVSSREWNERGKCPGPRNRASMSVFPNAASSTGAPSSRVVLFGGSGGIFGSGVSGEVNVFDADAMEWRRMAPTGSAGEVPSNRPWPGMVDVPAGSGVSGAPYVLVFGGDNNNDMWQLHGEPMETDALSCPYVFPLREFHGALMVISWGVLLPVGVLFARYGKGLEPKDLWFRVHRIVQSTGVILSIGGFISAVLMVPIHPWKLGHHFIGVIVFAIGIQQPLNACLRPHPPENRTTARVCWEHFHRTCGRIGVVLGMLNCIIGLFLIHASVAPIVIYLLWCAAVVVFVTVMEIRRCRSPASAVTASADAAKPTEAIPLS